MGIPIKATVFGKIIVLTTGHLAIETTKSMMKRFWGLVLLLTTVSTTSFAQHNIQGKVLDKNNEGYIEMATIRLLNEKDSTLVQGCLTDERGGFSLPKVKDGSYILEVRFLGYENSYRNILVASKAIILKNIYLEENSKNLKEVEVRGMTAQMAVKGDTIEYNSGAFKTAEGAVVEDLLKRLPGVVVDTDGKITVNGEEVKKVRVDGKKFFGDDITMATKNIPVDMIDKVQVVDQKSEMAQLTGFEDDNTERIINLTIKANRKKGVFGNLTAGGGADKDGNFRYDNNAFLSILNGNAQTTITGGANNTNNSRSSRGRGGMSGRDGITETQNIGVNNNTEISKTFKIGGDGTFNHSNNITETSSERENYGQGGFTYKDSKSNRNNKQANLRLELEWNVDTLTTLIIQPNVGRTNSLSASNSSSENLSDSTANSTKISWGKSNNNSESNGTDAGLNLIFSHKSKTKKGRTLTLNLGGSLSDSKGEGQNYSDKFTQRDTIRIDQHTTNTSKSYNANARVSFVEPLWNLKNFLETSASIRMNTRNSEKLQYDKNGSGVYNVLDSTYSNNFENNFYNESLELNFRHQEKDYNYMLGMKADPSQSYSTTYYKTGEAPLERINEVINWAPSAQFKYNFGRKKFARLDYRGRTSQPSIEQMQPVRNNNNLMFENIGNLALNPSFEHTLRLLYSSFNAERYSSLSVGLNGSYTMDALVSNSIYDNTRKEYNQIVNAEKAPFNVNTNLSFNTPIIKNRLQFNTGTTFGYSQIFGYSDSSLIADPYNEENNTLILGKLSKSEKINASETLSLTFTTDIIEIGTRGSVRYNNTQNNLNGDKNQKTLDWTGSGNLNLHLPYNLNISNDLSYTAYDGYSQFNNNEWVWNASIDKSLFKNKGIISLKLYDILQQKLNIRESIGDNYRQLSRSNSLTSYVMLSFTYKITKFGGGTTNSDMFRGGGDRRGRGGYPGGGFGGDNFQ